MATRVLTIAGTVWPRRRETEVVVTIFLTITFACGLIIAMAHVVNRGFIAPIYDVVANLTAFASAVAASCLLRHWLPAILSAVAFLLWLLLAQRTRMARRG